MHSAAAMVILRRQLSLAVLKFKPLEVVDDGLDAALLRLSRGKKMILPAILCRSLVAPGVEATIQLREDLGCVKRLQASQLHPAPAALLHLVQDEEVVREAVLPRGHSLEESRETTLPLHVDECLVLALPVQWGEGFSLQDQAQRHASGGTLQQGPRDPPAKTLGFRVSIL